MLSQLGKTDIYLLDQIMRGRFESNMRILDTGCGDGRNAEIFIRNGYDIYGVDKSVASIDRLHQNARAWNTNFDTSRFQVAVLEKLPFPDAYFNFIICSAVLHFAESDVHFYTMFDELIRVLQTDGTIWFRMTTLHTMEKFATHLQDNIYSLPDGSTRYLLTAKQLKHLMQRHQLCFADPFKTVNVDDQRAMATVVLQKMAR